ncbi:MAG: hypothetical protein ORN98_09715 [Alphaproteobacteria bacterium]|nr:hypothetical protein [Alphaproteobacteria bacterium]
MSSLTIQVSDESFSRLAELASATHQKIEDFARDTLEAHVARLADLAHHDSDVCPPECAWEPNAETLEAFAQYERGEYTSHNSVEELMACIKKFAQEKPV